MQSNVDTLPRPSAERRGAPRRRVRLSARLVYGSGTCSVGCTIRDISETGACVHLPDDTIVPDEVRLVDCEQRREETATVVWRLPPLVALKFKPRLV